MPKNNESGHNKNVANFETLISYVIAVGNRYLPSNPNILLDTLKQVLADSRSSLDAVTNTKNLWTTAVSEREIVFASLNQMVTRIINAFEASGVRKELITDAKSIVRKLKGGRVTPKKTTISSNLTDTDTEETKNSSVSQLGYDNRVENFGKFIDLLRENPAYNPNEPELKITALMDYLNDLRAKNSAVINARTVWSNARIGRQKVLYDMEKGLFVSATLTKKYLASVFSSTGAEYKQISSLNFNNIKI